MLKLLLGNPYVMGGVALAFLLMGVALYAENAGRVAAERGEKAALLQASLLSQDAKRWHDASDLRDKSIDVLNATLSKQNAAIEASKLDQARLESVAASAEADRAKLQSDLDARTAELDAFAKANPGKVCRLSDEVRERAAKLFTN